MGKVRAIRKSELVHQDADSHVATPKNYFNFKLFSNPNTALPT
jgi:hypothetical protein